jgi:hypothetical protein
VQILFLGAGKLDNRGAGTVAPIELVEGEKLLDMFENLELGLKPKKAYDLDMAFFTEYQN